MLEIMQIDPTKNLWDTVVKYQLFERVFLFQEFIEKLLF